MMAGTNPIPSRMRQSTVVAASGATFRMITAMTYAARMPMVIIHCWMIESDPRRLLGANSAM